MTNIEDRREAAANFLGDFHALCLEKRLYINNRQKNLETLISLGMTETEQYQVLMHLSVEDYVSGPDADRDRSGFVWVFGKQIDSVQVYIKLKVAEWLPLGSDGVQRAAKCLSFHVSVEPLMFPLKSRQS